MATGHNYSSQVNNTDWQNKGKFQKERKKTAVSPSTLYRVSQVKKNQTLEQGILSENLKREAAKQTYISYERQWQSQIRALTGAEW